MRYVTRHTPSLHNHLVTGLGVGALLLSILACSEPSPSTDLETGIGNNDAPLEEWEPEEVVIATGATHTLSVPSRYTIQSVSSADEDVSITQQSSNRVTIQTSALASEATISLELVDDQGSSGVIEVPIRSVTPDTVTLEAPNPLLFVGDEFTVIYDVAAAGQNLVGHGLDPFEAPEGVTITSGVATFHTGLFTSFDDRTLTLGVDPALMTFELTPRFGMGEAIVAERVGAEEIDGLRWFDNLPQDEDPDDEVPAPKQVEIEGERYEGGALGFSSLSVEATVGEVSVAGATFALETLTPEVCKFYNTEQKSGDEESEAEAELEQIRVGALTHFLVIDLREETSIEADCQLEATLEQAPTQTDVLTVVFAADAE